MRLLPVRCMPYEMHAYEMPARDRDAPREMLTPVVPISEVIAAFPIPSSCPAISTEYER